MVAQHFGEACFADMENTGLRNAEGEYIGGTILIEAPHRMLWANNLESSLGGNVGHVQG